MQEVRAVLQPQYGDAQTLVIGSAPLASLGPNEVRLRVHAASLNFGDRVLLQGLPMVFRLGLGLLRPSKAIVGMDAAGTVEAVGDQVTRLAVGDRVFGELGRGALAEQVVASESEVTHIPEGVSFEQAATLPIAARTALEGLQRAELRPGQRILVNGASGGVGTFAVQMAVARGAEVTAVCSGRNADLVRSLGATAVIDHTRHPYPEVARDFDVLFDLVGNHPLAQRRLALKPDGIYVSSFGFGGSRWFGPLGGLLWCAVVGLFDGRVRGLMQSDSLESLASTARMVADGTVKPVIERVYAFEDTAEAVGVLLSGRARGKLVIDVTR